MKDLFSASAKEYSLYRPDYPDELYSWLFQQVNEFELAWDCGTGSGQVAKRLAEKFREVKATDISQNQLDHAVELKNISYSKQPAENVDFPAISFDLITVAQAVHWFDFDGFYHEVKRTAKPMALLALMGYGLIEANSGNAYLDGHLGEVIEVFYSRLLGPYWDPERKYIDAGYRTIPFPFEQMETPAFSIERSWNLEELIGFFSSWSALKKFQIATGTDPLPELARSFQMIWGEQEYQSFRFPVILRVGRI
ncbi:MAG: methyltransferase domain-containing protein [Bacteroidetes bacterium]|nr:methyltransferase domain-containing protein [Bacteroidota bacterium]